MPSPKALRRLATNPSAYAHFAATGRVPEGVRPQGPLVDLLRLISPRDLAQLRGVTICEPLGYGGRRVFDNGLQALQWVSPSDEVFGTFPAESWRLKGFYRVLTIDDLVDACASAPEGFAARYPRLRRPSPRGTTTNEAAGPKVPGGSSSTSVEAPGDVPSETQGDAPDGAPDGASGDTPRPSKS